MRPRRFLRTNCWRRRTPSDTLSPVYSDCRWMHVALPNDIPAADQRRRELLSNSDWLTVDDVANRVGGRSLRQLRETRLLFGVWDPDNRNWRYPSFQFQEDLGLRPVIKELLDILPPGNGSGWSQIEWLYAPHPRIDSRPPVEIITSEPDLVVELARKQFASHLDAGW